METYKTSDSLELFEQLIESDHLTVTHLSLKENQEVPEHAHPWHVLVIPYLGKVEFSVENQQQILEPGTLIKLTPSEKHRLKALAPSEIMVIKMDLNEA